MIRGKKGKGRAGKKNCKGKERERERKCSRGRNNRQSIGGAMEKFTGKFDYLCQREIRAAGVGYAASVPMRIRI